MSRDFVEVVRCKDCIYYKDRKVNKKGFEICPVSGMDITPMDYCSLGERVNKGHWENFSGTNYSCSECGAWWSWDGTQEESGMNFCPSCGADMREESENAE